MSGNWQQNLSLLLPELFLLIGTCAILLQSAFSSTRQSRTSYILSTSIAAVFLVLVYGTGSAVDWSATAFGGSHAVDLYATTLKILIAGAVIVAFYYGRGWIKDCATNTCEHYLFGLFALLGASIMVSATNFLALYVGLELMSLSLYSIIAIYPGAGRRTEAAMKYFVLGALASGIFLYGVSMLYGATGVLDYAGIADALMGGGTDSGLARLSMVFIVAGLAFKFGAAPFHVWLPDVYQGAPTPVTLFLATVPKLAVYGMTARLLINALPAMADLWTAMLGIAAALSMVIGNFAALRQTDMKRLLSYSAIAHAGFLLIGLVSADGQGMAAAMFYAILYTIMSLGAFGLITLMEKDGHAVRLSDMSGLAARQPWYALLLTLLMFSMAGVPPLGGFWAKWFVLQQAIASGHITLAVIAVFCSVVGAFYYLRIICLAYFGMEKASDRFLHVTISMPQRIVISINILALPVIGLFPAVLMNLCLKTIS